MEVHDLTSPDWASRPGGPATVHLFGGPYVTVDGTRLQVPEGSKRLLAFIALRRGPVERRYVAGTLWPMGSDGRAAGNLRSALWRLRSAGIEIMHCDKWSLRLDESVQVDVRMVLEWAGRLTGSAPTAENDLTVSTTYFDALDLLPGWYDDWAIMERERLRQRVLHALEALSRRLVTAGRFGEAVDAAITATAAEPLRESAQRALIEVHVSEGNWVEARRVFLTYRDLVQRELGIRPSRELAAYVYGASQESSMLGGPHKVASLTG